MKSFFSFLFFGPQFNTGLLCVETINVALQFLTVENCADCWLTMKKQGEKISQLDPNRAL